ncbi:MAG: hypothetical protein K1Y02_01230 [Candidatus Hydrogenedentes bacterium]|nr:hypothetical protein [Candidatus Hydrogenedentota bacterium]
MVQRAVAMLLFLVAAVSGTGAEPDLIVLDNGAIRVEFDPGVFAVRFVGVPGGENAIAPLPIPKESEREHDWVDAGGLQTDLLPFTGLDPAIRRGPGKVLEVRSDYFAVLGPVSSVSGMQVKKEVQLVGREGKARFRVTAFRAGPEPGPCAIRNTARLQAGSSVRLERKEGEVRMLSGGAQLVPFVVRSLKYWLIPVPPTARAEKVVLGAFASGCATENKSGFWTRKLSDKPSKPEGVSNGCTFLCLLDDATKTYGVALQSETKTLATGASMSLEEEWKVERRGRK